jgi:hypothetical protein
MTKVGQDAIEGAIDPGIVAALRGQGQPMASPGVSVDAGLSIQIGKLASAIEAQTAAQRQLAADVWPVNVVLPQIGASSDSSGMRQLTRPSDGFVWDMSSISAASFSAGTVSVYRGSVSDANLKFVFTQTGTYTIGGKVFFIKPGDNLLFVCSAAVTPFATVSFDCIQVAVPRLAEYLI